MNKRSAATPVDGWGPDRGRERSLLLLEVARMYYEEDLSQERIAREIGYSRPTVSRMLDEAKHEGIVRVQIMHPVERLTHLEDLLKTRFSLEKVRVTSTSTPHAGVVDVGRAAADLLDRLVQPGMTIGLSNGRTHMAMVNAPQVHRTVEVTFVQMVGSLGGNDQLVDGPELCRRFAEAYGATYRLLNAPLLAPNQRTAKAFLSEPTIAATLRIAAGSDIAIVGIGAGLRRPAGVFSSWLTPTHVRALQAHGAVGHVLGHFFDRQGRTIGGPHREVVIGLTLEQLAAIPQVLAVAAGAEKAPALAAALRGGLVNSVILDYEAAQALAYLPAAERQ